MVERLGVGVVSLAEIDPHLALEEDGETFSENATKKARVVAETVGRPALADDSGLEVDVLDGLKEGGQVLVNTDRTAEELGVQGPFCLFTFSADDLAREILGRPIMNTALLGAFAAVTGELSLEAALQAVLNKFPGELGGITDLQPLGAFEHLHEGPVVGDAHDFRF